MHGSDPDPLITISAAAVRLGIDRSVLSRQIKSGAVRAYGQKVKFSEVLADRAANIDLTRSGRRDGRGEHENQGRKAPRASGRASTRASVDARPAVDAADVADEVAEDAAETVLVDGRLMTTAQARAMKESYLALLRKLEFEVKERDLVDRAAAEKLFFDTAREGRDAWLSWPARVGIPMADEIKIDPTTGKVDPRSLVAVLNAYVRQHLEEMGEPSDPEWKEPE